MEHHFLIELTAIFVLGIGAQWVSWRMRLPAILMLLLCGLLAGPVFGFINPDRLLGDLLFPFVSLAVGVILFEGGLTLKFSDLRETRSTVLNLIFIGAAVTWAGASVAAVWILGFELRLALLLGAVVVVTGPTVIGPLLRHVQPTAKVGSTLKWEGILIDPIGATLALLVFEAIIIAESAPASEAARAVAIGIGRTILAGGLAGGVGALILVQMLKRYWIPDYLQSVVALGMVLAALVASDAMQPESGLLAVTLMGVILANQKSADIHAIIEFKENLKVLLISTLFILLSARLRIDDLSAMPWRATAFVIVLIVLVRPLAVWLSTLGSPLSWPEKGLIAWMAPRGIVAAAVASVFGLRLVEADIGIAQADLLAPVTFMVIIGTVAVYGLTASPIARALGVAFPNPQGILLVGAHYWARDLARVLTDCGIPVLLTDTNRANIRAARMAGLPSYLGNALSEHATEEMDLTGIGRMMALTGNDEINALAAVHYAGVFSRAEAYQLASSSEAKSELSSERLRGRELFGSELTHARMSRLFAEGATIKRTPLTESFTYEDFRELYGEDAVALMMIESEGRVRIMTVKDPPAPGPGTTLLSLVKETRPTARIESPADPK